MNIQKLVSDSVKQNQVRELYLYKVPVLKTVDDWNNVEALGRISFQGKHVNYRGALMEYKGKIYFVKESVINALSSLRDFKLNNQIEVIDEKTWKKRKK